MQKNIRLSKASIGLQEKEAVSKVLENEYLGMGEETKNFENEIKDYIGNDRQVISVSSGTSALNLAISSLGFGPGDEIIVPSITYVASFQAIAACGVKPVSCDVELKTGFISSKEAKKLITKNTKAIMPVHYSSQSNGIEEIYDLANKFNLRVIEDAAQAFGCEFKGKKIGSFGDIICFSFDGIKNITCGEGGAILTGDLNLANKLRDARLLGVEKDTEARFTGKRSWIFDVNNVGYRYHLSNIMAAIGSEQLKKIEFFGNKRREIANFYMSNLESIPEVTLFDFKYQGVIPHIYPIRIEERYRDSLKDFLLKEGIETGFHYYPNHKLTLFKNLDSFCPNSEQLERELISLPLHVDITPEEMQHVIKSINIFFNEDLKS